MPQKNKVVRNVRLKKTPILALLALIIVLVLSLVLMFIFFVKKDLNSNPNTKLISVLSSNVTSDNTTSNASSDSTSSALNPSNTSSDKVSSSQTPSNSDASSEGSSSESDVTQQVKVETQVPETVSVDKSYFNDAIFIGDSISKGLKLYGILDDKNVIADQNVKLYQIYNNQKVYYINNKDKVTLWDALKKKQSNPKKIYVLLGSNGIPGLENSNHITYYYDLVDKLKDKYPNAIIYIVSVTPITKDSNYTRPSFNMKKITDFNKLVYKMAQEEQVYYLDAASFLKDKNGYLKSDYASSDGLHLTAKGHSELFKFYKTHVVSSDGYATVKVEDNN